MERKIIIAGSGGQGILFFGKVLAFAGMYESKEVTWFPSYGAEMRGGTANCTVVISDDMIGSPVVLNPDILITMNKASLDKFQRSLKKNGLLFFDGSLIKNPDFRSDIEPVSVPATKIASSIGNTKSANMVMLGSLIAKTSLLKKSSIVKIFESRSQLGKNSTGKMNINSVLEGIKYIEDKKS
ncbi:MAG: 2-oxoacid:acceptor oxidoreductase family protein [Nitrospirota bacterium]